MEISTNKSITIKEMVLSFSILGVVAVVCMFIWKRLNTIDFLIELFNPANLVQSSLYGIGCGVIFSVFVLVLARITKTKIPKDENNDMLVELMKKPYGPAVVAVLPGIFEELFFRGFLLALFLSFFNSYMAIILSTFVFWIIHVPQYKTNIVLNSVVIMLSVIVSLLFIEFGTLWAPILAHCVYNYFVTLFVKKNFINVY